MQDLSSFKEKISPKLDALETKRQYYFNKNNRLTLAYSIPVIFSIFFCYFFYSGTFTQGFFILFMFIALAIGVFLNSRINQNIKDYQLTFKGNVLNKFVQTFYSDVKYDPHKWVHSSQYLTSGLFERDYMTYKGEDFFKGQTNHGYDFQFSELYVSKGLQNSEVVHFTGLYYVINIPDIHVPHIAIFSKNSSRSKRVQDFVIGIPKRSFGNTQLDQYCAVYSPNENIDLVITTEIARAIHTISSKWNRSFSIAFKDHKIHLAIDERKNFFDTKIDAPIDNSKFIKTIYEELTNVFFAVEQLSDALSSIDKIALDELNKIALDEAKKELPNNDDDLFNHLIDFGE